MKNILKHLAVTLIMISVFSSCSNPSDEEDVFTMQFYVFNAYSNDVNVIPEVGSPVTKDKKFGYLLFVDHGNPGYFIDDFYWAENLPKEYQKYLLPVIVTYRITKEPGGDCRYPVIKIIDIKKKDNN